MRPFLLLVALVWGLALGQGLVRGVTPEEVEGLLREMGVVYEKRDHHLFLLELASPKVWLELDWCEEGRCGLVALSAGFRKKVDLEHLNAWNRDYRFSRAYLDREGDPWVEWELDLTGGVSWEALREFLRLFAEAVLPKFMEHIGFEP
ncbi:MAG: YbjN domain-containing protein [Thermus sp.]|uniref:YbjN domain-containing protein n=1 Tax=Thermus sp. TaxID=275 RepID=UPI00391DED49